MLRLLYITLIVSAVYCPGYLHAQDDEVSLGDVARAYRKSKAPDPDNVIDNDNLVPFMDKAESQRLEGMPVSSVKKGIFTTVSPDGSCSLSFDARNVNPTAVAYIATDLPQDELPKLDGPAAIQDGELAVSVHNGTQWEVKEIVVAVTPVQAQSAPPEYRFATLSSAPVTSPAKAAERTLLYRLKGSVLADSTSVFHAPIERTIGEAQDWRWTIVGARGIPPAAQSTLRAQTGLVQPSSTAMRSGTELGPGPGSSTSQSMSSTEPGHP